MDTQSAFWEMIRDMGSSAGELSKLGIRAIFIEGQPLVNLSRASLNNAPEPSGVTWNIQVTYDSKEVDLRDPSSFDILEAYVESVRRLPPTSVETIFSNIQYTLEDPDANL